MGVRRKDDEDGDGDGVYRPRDADAHRVPLTCIPEASQSSVSAPGPTCESGGRAARRAI